MTFKISTTRRHILVGSAALAAAPVLSAVPAFAAPAAQTSPISRLWDRAQSLSRQMRAHETELGLASARSTLPPWMVASGRANMLGNARYETIVQILHSPATSLDDLAIIGKATNDHDMQNGPKSWAHARFDRAASNFHGAALA